MLTVAACEQPDTAGAFPQPGHLATRRARHGARLVGGLFLFCA